MSNFQLLLPIYQPTFFYYHSNIKRMLRNIQGAKTFLGEGLNAEKLGSFGFGLGVCMII